MKRNKSIFTMNSLVYSFIFLLTGSVVVEGSGVVQAKVGDTANFTWSFASSVGYGAVSKVTLGPWQSNKMSYLIGMYSDSKVILNPNLSEKEEFRDRVQFSVDIEKGTATFLYKNIQESDADKVFGVEVYTLKEFYQFNSKLEIVEPPRFVVTSAARIEVNEGANLNLDCEATGKPKPSIEWRVKGSNAILTSGEGSKQLVFGSISRANHSEYQCTASNVAGKTHHSVTIIVNYLPVIDESKSSKTLYSYVGNPNAIILECFADGRPSPTYFWKDNFGQNVSLQARYSLVNPKDAQLGFSYQCFAANKVGVSKPHLVKVEKLEKPGSVAARVSKKTSRSLTVQWTLPNETGGAALVAVVITLTDSKGNLVKEITNAPEITNKTFKNLQPFSQYDLEFIAKNQVLESLPFKLKERTSEEAPGVPRKLESGDRPQSVEGELSIQWLPPEKANGIIRYYEVAYGINFMRQYNLETASKVTTNETKMTLKNLMGYMKYNIQVRAATIEPGPWTNILPLMTPTQAPTEPRNLTCENVNPTEILLTWKQPEYIYGPIGAFEGLIKYIENGKERQRNDFLFPYPMKREWRLQVTPFMNYTVGVREAAGAEKWGPYSKPCSLKTLEGVPTEPKDVKITHRTTNAVSLSWQRPDHFNGILTHFVVFYENATRRYQQKIGHDLNNQTYFHRLYNLNLATKYTVMIRAFTAAGGGKLSKPIETSTRPSVAAPRDKPNDEIATGPIIGGIFSFLVIVVLLVILILYIARKQRMSKSANIPDLYEESPPPEQRLLPPPTFDEKVPDVVTTNGKMPVDTRNSFDEKPTKYRCFISSRPIKLDELKDVCDRLHANKDAGFIQEFKGISPRQTDQTLDISLRKENKCKNRYNNVLAYDHSRVILSYIENIPGSDYINANYVDGYNVQKKFIATQGPVAASFNDFWRMVWEQNSDIIVMVTNLIEKSRIKCQKYWPTGDTREYGSIRVTPEEEMELAEYVVRKFSISMVSGNKRHGSRKVTQYQFTGWPDHGVPQYATGLLQFIRKIRVSAQDCSGPIICHCSAGVGRSGTFITLDSMLDQISGEGTVDVHGFLTHIRSQRNFMVQTEAQYIFIHDALLEAVICGDTEVHVKDLSTRINSLQQINPQTNKTFLEEEFERLTYNLEENHVYEAGFLEVNAKKNRFSTVVPIESNRLKLWPYPEVEGSDYINANFVDGYQQREAFVLTQAPMENTVEDFWRMIWEYEVFSIVMISSPDEHDESHCFPYWPYNSEPANIGLLIIQIAAEENKNGFVKREFRATNSKTGETRVVTHLMYYDWPEKGSPEDSSFLIAMIGQLQKTQQVTGNGSIVIHCSDGCGRSGTFAAIIFCIERLKVEGIVDVFQTSRMMRTQRPHVIRTLDQYLFCYNAVKKFVDKFSDYANFK